MEAPKNIEAVPDWSARGKKLTCNYPLSIEGVVEEGLFLRGCALEHRPYQEVVLQIEYHGVIAPGGGGPISRIEWNTLRPHNNKGRGPAEYRYIDQHPSHIHSFDDNWSDANGALLTGNLPVARPITESIQGFTDLLDFAGKVFKINNMRRVIEPPWVATLDFGDANE